MENNNPSQPAPETPVQPSASSQPSVSNIPERIPVISSTVEIRNGNEAVSKSGHTLNKD